MPSSLLALVVRVVTWTRARTHPAERERGQATAEYALVLLGAALVALLLVAWATAGGGAAKVGRLFDKTFEIITGKVE